MSRLRLRTPKDVDAAARWTRSPVKGWRYWLATALIFAVVWVLAERWVLVTALAFVVGVWLRDKFLASPALDKEAPKHGPRGTLTANSR